MIELRTVHGHNGFCGPAVISTLTGMSTDGAAFLLRMHTGRRTVTKTSPPEVIAVLRALELHVEQLQIFTREKDGPTLLDWLATFPRPKAGVVLIGSTGHWQVVSGDLLVDNQFRIPMPWRGVRKRYLRDRVETVWAVTRNEFTRENDM